MRELNLISIYLRATAQLAKKEQNRNQSNKIIIILLDKSQFNKISTASIYTITTLDQFHQMLLSIFPVIFHNHQQDSNITMTQIQILNFSEITMMTVRRIPTTFNLSHSFSCQMHAHQIILDIHYFHQSKENYHSIPNTVTKRVKIKEIKILIPMLSIM